MNSPFPAGTLEAEFIALLGGDRNACITARYYGLDGRGGTSLQKTGDEAGGITRERVRQISEQVVARLGGGERQAPVFDQVLSLIGDNLPCSGSQIEVELHQRGLTFSKFRIEGIVAGAPLLGRSLPFTIADIGGRMVVRKNDCARIGLLMSVVRRNIRRWGASTIARVAAEAGGKGKPAPGDWVRRTVTSFEAFRWLDESSGWFWLSDVSINRIVNRMHKILVVAGPISLPLLIGALGRHHRMRGFDPPCEVLRELCRQLPGVVIEGDLVRATGTLDRDAILSPVERVMVDILAANNDGMKKSQIVSSGLESGINRFTICQYLGYSPIVSRDATDRYRLVGSMPAFEPTAPETLVSAPLCGD